LCANALPSAVARAQLTPARLYVPLNQAVTVTVADPEPSGEKLSVRLIDPVTGSTVSSAPTRSGEVDLASMFPSLWAEPAPRVLLAQLVRGDEEFGPPLVLQPLIQREPARDGLTQEAMEAIRLRDAEALSRLSGLTDAERTKRASTPALDNTLAYCGLRLYEDRLVRLQTTAGPITIALRPEHAPNTAFLFRTLVDGGLYNGTVFHRVVAADAMGRPFLVQAGDPTGAGQGGPGFHTEFEPSTLPHDLGVLSLARRPTELNSGGSQFFICLSREACAALDGRYTAFGQVIGGVEALDIITAVPTGPIDPDNPASAHERPLDPPVIESASTISAPPFSRRAAPITRAVSRGIER